MRAHLLFAAGCLALLPALPQAQPHGSEAVLCESRDRGYRECRLPFRGEAALLEQTSRASCQESRSWGVRGRYVWVDRGCGGWFVEAARPGPTPPGWGGGERTITCESDRGRRRTCDTPGWRGIELVREHSRNACQEGRSFGFEGGKIWVDRGCRADFAESRRGPQRPPAPPPKPEPPIQGGEIVCTSEHATFKQCPVPGWRGARLVRNLKGRCEEGRSWGFANEAIWVHYGCSGVFVATAGTAPQPDPGYPQVTCESRDGRRHECRADIGNAAVWLDRQTSQVLCEPGRNWGWNARAIWVDGGCGGVFTIQRRR